MAESVERARTGARAGEASDTRRLAIRGSGWLLGGQVLNQGLRLVSNLILTRLLAPELFGLIALAQVVNRGVSMFADVGLRGNVVQHPRGDEHEFLDTVWSVQILRGVVLWVVILLLAGPAADFYAIPELRVLMPLLGLTMVFTGFQSTAVYSVIRHVQPKRRVLFQAGAKFAGVVVMLVWAVVSPNIWALAAGGLTTGVLTAVSTWYLVPGRRHDRPGFDPSAARAILQFGRWILLSTALTFVLQEADRLALGKLVSPTELGIYTIGALFSASILAVVSKLAVDVLFPIYAKIARDPARELRLAGAKMRAAVLAVALPPLWALALAGPALISFLYDARYHDAGWMAQILAVGAVAQALTVTSERMLLAVGDSYRHMWGQFFQTAGALVAMAIGGLLGGLVGLLIGLAVGRWLGWAAVTVLVVRQGHSSTLVDAAAIGATVAVVGGGMLL